jgi:hypothetical protein
MPESFRLSTEHTRTATLGCGSLILIALIVAIFSKGASDDVERGIGGLRSDVQELKRSIDAQSQQIREMHDALKKREPAKKTAEAMPEKPFDLQEAPKEVAAVSGSLIREYGDSRGAGSPRRKETKLGGNSLE